MTRNFRRMPRLSDSMSEATIVAWLKQPGEASDGVIFRELASLTVTSDHRAVYGADAAHFPRADQAAPREPACPRPLSDRMQEQHL